MARQTRESATHLFYDGWLLADDGGALKLSRTQPRAGIGEVAISITITVPKSLFARPMLRAAITLPERPAIDPAEAIRVVADVIERGVGFSVDVTMAENQPKDNPQAIGEVG